MAEKTGLRDTFAFPAKEIMMVRFKGVFLLVGFLLGSLVGQSQMLEPVKWEINLHKQDDNLATLVATCTIDAGWHVYALEISDEPIEIGPFPTEFFWTELSGVDTVGTDQQCEYIAHPDPVYDNANLFYFEDEAVFKRDIQINDPNFKLSGELSYMACDDEQCVFPQPIPFNFTAADLKEAPVPNCPVKLLQPVDWEFKSYQTDSEGEFELWFTANVDDHWHIYSTNLDGAEGPLPTEIFYAEDASGYELVGNIEECNPIVEYDPNFQMDLRYYEHEAVWIQRVKSTGAELPTIKGDMSFMVCDSARCLPPEYAAFALDLNEALPASERPEPCPHDNETDHGATTGSNAKLDKMSLFEMFASGFAWGFVALLTPCVFPMIPMTVSFFTKQSKTRAVGIRNAIFYGVSIIAIYTGLGLLITAIFGADALNLFSTDPYFNLFLFALLVIFGISFLGAFEIQLPSSWANKMDMAASKRSGFVAIFLMAGTLAIVSFSCTGALVGSALATAAKGGYGGPALVLFGFSLALSLPFMLFAIFPSWLNTLPKSGGWLNSVKVVLGLVEIAFAFKFLSNADLVWQAGLLKREVFIGIWVAISLLTALYLFGAYRLPHDSKLERLSVTRFFFGLFFVFMTIYLIPGMWGGKVELISGYPPPMTYAENVGGIGAAGGSGGGHGTTGGHFEVAYFDYDEAMAAAKSEGKPLLIDYTGWACVNCRKMEETIWPNKEVAKRMMEDFVVVSLYVDERTKLPESEWRVEEYGGKEFRIRTIGNKWSYMQASKYNVNAQPYYVVEDHDGSQLGGSAAWDSDPQVFIDFLEEGKRAFEKKH